MTETIVAFTLSENSRHICCVSLRDIPVVDDYVFLKDEETEESHWYVCVARYWNLSEQITSDNNLAAMKIHVTNPPDRHILRK